jgi:uncharacterized RDD family membrane protein YckC
MNTSAVLIRTPEGIVFSRSLAGPVTRFLAWLVDVLTIVSLTAGLGHVLSWFDVIGRDAVGAAYTLGYFFISFGYGIGLEWAWRGQTLGKKLFRLRVVDAEGMRLQFDQIVTRNLLRFVDMLPVFYLVGGVACWSSRKCQRLGDIAANTLVVTTPSIAEPDLDQLLAGKFNSLVQYPHLAARLRQNVSPGEVSTALQALIRRDELEPGARLELFAKLATHFRAKVDFPAEATDGLADEQYVRNVVDVVFRTRNTAKKPIETSPSYVR